MQGLHFVTQYQSYNAGTDRQPQSINNAGPDRQPTTAIWIFTLEPPPTAVVLFLPEEWDNQHEAHGQGQVEPAHYLAPVAAR